MPCSPTDKLPAFIQCGKQVKSNAIVGLTLPDLSMNTAYYCQLAPHYLYAKTKSMGADGLAYRVLTPDTIAEVQLYDFDLEKMTVAPKDVELPDQQDDSGIPGLEAIPNPFSAVKYSDTNEIFKIGSQASRQAVQKSAMNKPKFSPTGSSTNG